MLVAPWCCSMLFQWCPGFAQFPMFHLHADEKTPSPRGYTRNSWSIPAGWNRDSLGLKMERIWKRRWNRFFREYRNDWGMLDKYSYYVLYYSSPSSSSYIVNNATFLPCRRNRKRRKWSGLCTTSCLQTTYLTISWQIFMGAPLKLLREPQGPKRNSKWNIVKPDQFFHENLIIFSTSK